MSSIIATQPLPSNPTMLPSELLPDITNLVIQDDTPVESLYAEKLMRFLVTSLNAGWLMLYPHRKLLAMANVGLFHSTEKPPVVPDVMVSLDLDVPVDLRFKKYRSYFMWVYGKPPDLALEIVSNKEGNELGSKLDLYAYLGIPYYVVWDPDHYLSLKDLQCFSLQDKKYQENGPWFPGMGIGVKGWRGVFEHFSDTWLRWCDAKGDILLTAEEQLAKLTERPSDPAIEPKT